MEAPDQAAVVRRLQTAGHLPISADSVSAAGSGSFLSRDLFARSRANRRDVQMITRELATLIQAGLPLDRSLKILIDLTERVRALFRHTPFSSTATGETGAVPGLPVSR